ncbi:MAG: PorV/PorQ family protein [Gemmatimonadetes bacterium]|nr:PorV/PorQ family protein [Gemmatimonadota bacterium]
MRPVTLRELLPARSVRRGGVVAAALVLVASAGARAADPGETGLAFLKIGVGARAAAMGEAYVAVAQDPTATYWNPAGIANVPGNEIHASHSEWISDVRYEYLAAVHGMKGHAVGVHAGLLHMGKLDRRDESANFTGTFDAYDFVVGATYAYRPLRSVEVGVTGKFLYEKIDNSSVIGFAGDLGMRYRTPLRGLVLAATATNVGPPLKFVADEFVIPFQVRMGAAYRTRRVLQGLIVSGDLRFPNDSDAKAHVGAELWVHEAIALRGGLKGGYDEEAGAIGFGVKYQNYLFDYAYVPFSESSQLGDTHRISFGWRPDWIAGSGE